jgi:maltooligosyltrehalose trehalohydrolase
MSETPIDPHKRQHAHCLPFGAHLTDATHTRYRFWAPSLESVRLELYDDDQKPTLIGMNPTGDGRYEALAV